MALPKPCGHHGVAAIPVYLRARRHATEYPRYEARNGDTEPLKTQLSIWAGNPNFTLISGAIDLFR